MICPVCHTEIADSATVCPACHADLSATRVMPKLTGSWCPSCGALVPAGAATCPKCGVATNQSRTAQNSAARADLQNRAQNIDASRTATLPRIESAIPSEPEPSSEPTYGRDGMPRTKVFLFAAIASLLIVGGGILLITHPWNPDLNNTRATTPADTSKAGYPGEIDRLSGQDSKTEAISVVSADEQTYIDLLDAYMKLDELCARADELDARLDTDGISSDENTRSVASEQAQALSIEVSNLASKISGIETSTTGTYTEDQEHMATLVSWLRNRIEAIVKAWNISANSADPEADKSKILAPMQGNRESDGATAYVNLFKENFTNWAVVEK